MKKSLLIACLVSLFVSSYAEEISLGSLLKEMTDRDSVAKMPNPSFQLLQASSYDRRATTPENPHLWWSNTDHTHFLRTEKNQGREEFVMLEDEGAGAIVRWWMAWKGPQPEGNKLRIYIDKNPVPAVEASVEDVVGGKLLVGAPLSNIVPVKSRNLYFPIPYAKHCKVTFEGPPRRPFYYIINYRSYDKGTNVKSFSMDQLKENKELIDKTQEKLKNSFTETKGLKTKKIQGKLSSGASKSISLDGPAAIRGMTFKISADDLQQALRSTVIKIEFDGVQTVYTPIGEFFGTGYMIHPYKSWYTEVKKDGTMSCQWVMPFKTSAKVTVENLGKQPVSIEIGEVKSGEWKWDDRSMHFGSTWFQLTKIDSRRKSAPCHFDVNFVTLEGRGNYVGDTLTLFNGYYFWWGEGDEKIYVDGAKFPTHFGTGSEDYYGYAWGDKSKEFTAPFHAQPSAKGNNSPGLTVNLRQRSLDTIPFQKSLKLDMELLHKRLTKVNYAPTTFWYAFPGVKVNIKPDPETMKLPVTKKLEDIVVVFPTDGVVESEKMKVEEGSAGKTVVVPRGDTAIVSNFTSLRWMNAKVGDTLTLTFELSEAQTLPLFARMLRVRGVNLVDIGINGEKLAQKVNMNFKNGSFDNVSLGNVALKKGKNTISFTLTQLDSKSRDRYVLNFDCLFAEKDGKRIKIAK